MLFRSQEEGELGRFEELVTFWEGHPDRRVRFQFLMHKLGYTGKYSLYDYIDNLDYLGERSNTKHFVLDLLFFPLIGMLWVNFSVGVIGLILLMVYNITVYFREKNEIDPYVISFAYILRLMAVCDELEKEKNASEKGSVLCRELERISTHKKRLQRSEERRVGKECRL